MARFVMPAAEQSRRRLQWVLYGVLTCECEMGESGAVLVRPMSAEELARYDGPPLVRCPVCWRELPQTRANFRLVAGRYFSTACFECLKAQERGGDKK